MDSDRPGRADAGSSPLARGTHLCFIVEMVGNRFIPAGAGNTTTTRRTTMRDPVHPRWRGEHNCYHRANQFDGGSSPLARGTLCRIYRGGFLWRFIPAGAGNTASQPPSRTWPTVHPRWRGEHSSSRASGHATYGSSPLARGTPKPGSLLSGRSRFIPAGAGNTHGGQRHQGQIPVHPRWRGEHRTSTSPSRASVGSSPLARGTPPR